jgi:hypothetical protein
MSDWSISYRRLPNVSARDELEHIHLLEITMSMGYPESACYISAREEMMYSLTICSL